MVAAHHNHLNAVTGRVDIASSLAQAMTKRQYDARHAKSDFAVGNFVLVYRTAPNKLLPHFIGPFVVTKVREGGSFVDLRHYLSSETTMAEVSVGRLIHFDASRASNIDLTDFQLELGSFVVLSVIEHRQQPNGAYEFHALERYRSHHLGAQQESQACRSGDRVLQRQQPPRSRDGAGLQGRRCERWRFRKGEAGC